MLRYLYLHKLISETCSLKYMFTLSTKAVWSELQPVVQVCGIYVTNFSVSIAYPHF